MSIVNIRLIGHNLGERIYIRGRECDDELKVSNDLQGVVKKKEPPSPKLFCVVYFFCGRILINVIMQDTLQCNSFSKRSSFTEFHAF